METIQVVLDSKLLRATDRAARRTKLNRSALIRDAIREHLQRLETRELEERDRQGYESAPPRNDELSRWESEVTWPADQPEETFVFTRPLLRISGGQWLS